MPQPPILRIASVCYGGLAHARFMRSLMALRTACAARAISLQLDLRGGEALISRARAAMLATFLSGEATHLVFIDSEAAFEPDELIALVEAGDPIASTPDDRLFVITRAAAQRLAEAYPDLRAGLGDMRGGDARAIPMLFESLLADRRYISDLDAVRARWAALGAPGA